LNDSVVQFWAPSFRSFGGGIGCFSRHLASALAAVSKVHLAGKLDKTGTWNGLPLWGVAEAPPWLRTLGFAGGLIGSAWRHRPRLIVCGHVNFSPAALALHRLLGIPYVVLAYGIDVGPTLSHLKRQALRDAQAIWAISQWTRGRVVLSGVQEERVKVLPVTVSESAFEIGPPSEALRQRHAIGSEERVVLTVARLDAGERYKGCDQVLRSLRAVRQAVGPLRYLVVGGGDDLPRLRALAEALQIQELVTFCGFVPDDQLPDYYRNAHAFVMPSVAEGFGIVFLEAMASGTPVVGGNKDGTVDALAGGELGLLVDPESSEAIAGGLISILKRAGPALWFDPQALRRRCLELYGQDAFARRLRSLVDPLLGGAG
jgi:glycosyltransferase involved in cell wall biosynthesis